MKKLLSLLLIFMMVLSGCGNKSISNSITIDINDIDILTISALPSPPKIKKVDRKSDIKQVISFINSISKKQIKLEEDINGWEFIINTKGKKLHSISFIGNMINIDKIWYEVDANEIKKMREMYNELNYPEEYIK